jgi:predicted transcriptional regulator of viral defense system
MPPTHVEGGARVLTLVSQLRTDDLRSVARRRRLTILPRFVIISSVAPSLFPRLMALAEEHDGIIPATAARAAGILPNTLTRLAERGTLERVARGVYRLPAFPAAAAKHAQFQIAIAWASANNGPAAVVSHESALALFGVSDALPEKIHITINPKSRIRRATPKLYAVHRDALAPADRTTHDGVATTTVERAILDTARAGRNDLALGAIADARRLGYISKSTENRIRAQIARP